MRISEDKMIRIVKRQLMKARSVKPWPEINGLIQERKNGTRSINGTKSSNQSSGKHGNTAKDSGKHTTKSVEAGGQGRRLIKEICKNLSLFIASVIVILGSLLAIWGVIVLAHMELHGKL
jgi:hypothetical protein